MRKLLALVLHGLQADKEPRLLDHAPLSATDPVVEKERPRKPHAEKLAEARQRHGRAFKCAAPGVDREVMIVPDQFRIIKAGHAPTQGMARASKNVTTLRERSRP